MPMHDDRERYLQEVLGYIKFPLDRADVYDELNAHIEDNMDSFISEGFSSEDFCIKKLEICILNFIHMIRCLLRMHGALIILE